MSGCLNTGRPGCRSTLCLGAHSFLRKLPVRRYPSDALGRPDTTAHAVYGMVCAVVSSRSSAGASVTDIPGTVGGITPLRITAAAGSLEPILAPGDRVTVNGALWRVISVSAGEHLTADLLPDGEA